MPEASGLAAAYGAVEDPAYLAEEAGRRRTFAGSLARLRALRPAGDLLDVGCYAGTFLTLAREAGFRVTGLELSRWATGIARARLGGRVARGGLPALPFGPGRFDVVTGWDVIEHLAAPREALAAIHRVLRPGGLLALSTHLLDSAAGRWLGACYPFLQEMHLVHFTRPALGAILEATGFRLLRLAGHTRYVSARYLAGRLVALLLSGTRMDRPVGGGGWLVPVRGLGLIEAYAAREP
jgi:SAM-dependent methyltransferase